MRLVRWSTCLLSASLLAVPLQAARIVPVPAQVPVVSAASGIAVVGTGIPLQRAMASRSSAMDLPLPTVTVGAVSPPASFMEGASLAPQVGPSARPTPSLNIRLGGGAVGAAAHEARGLSDDRDSANGPASAADSLGDLAAGLRDAGGSDAGRSARISGGLFDQSGSRGPPVEAAHQERTAAPATLGFPPGVRTVSVEVVRNAADVERVIPGGDNSNILKAELKRNVAAMAPYLVYIYQDSRGGRFAAIDLAARPELVEMIPELALPEVQLIKKLLRIHGDIRVLVREDGKTPDLVMGGRVVEIKSFFAKSKPLAYYVNQANTQVKEHAQRHGLGNGALAVDLITEDRVPADLVKEVLDSWQAGASDVALDRVLVFSRGDLKVFIRQSDGSFDIDPLPAAN